MESNNAWVRFYYAMARDTPGGKRKRTQRFYRWLADVRMGSSRTDRTGGVCRCDEASGGAGQGSGPSDAKGFEGLVASTRGEFDDGASWGELADRDVWGDISRFDSPRELMAYLGFSWVRTRARNSSMSRVSL